jgi:hypothetical protein
MNQVFRVSRGSDFGKLVDGLDELKEFVRDNGPGRYRVDEIGADPFSSGHTSRRGGVVIAKRDGTIELDRDPWPE